MVDWFVGGDKCGVGAAGGGGQVAPKVARVAKAITVAIKRVSTTEEGKNEVGASLAAKNGCYGVNRQPMT